MYDAHAQALIDSLPPFPDLDRTAARRALAAAYFHVIRLKLSLPVDSPSGDDVGSVSDTLRRLVDTLESVAIFDPLHGVPRPAHEKQASAFVAGEALALLADLRPVPESSEADVLQSPRVYA